MLMPLPPGKRRWAAFCDACLIGSPVFTYEHPRLGRRFAVESLRALGWSHETPPNLPTEGQAIAAQAWTGETFCFDCAARRARSSA